MTRPPPIQRWWVTHVAVAAIAVVAVIAAFDSLTRILHPVGHLALLMLFAIVVAFILAPLATRLEGVTRRPGPASALAFLVAVVVVIVALALLAAPLISESSRLTDQLPHYIERLQSAEPVSVLGYQVPDELRTRVGAAAGDAGGRFAGEAVGIVLAIVSGVVDLFLVLVIALYLLLDRRRIRTLTLRALPPRLRTPTEQVEGEVVRVFGAYVRGQLVLALIVGFASTVALLALGVPYALVLGVLAGLFELVPLLGPLLGAVPAVLVALSQPFPTVIWVVLAFLAIQQAESNLLVPRISGHAVGLHPLAAILALLVGLEVGGIVGALFAVPLAGVVWVFVGAALRARQVTSGLEHAERGPSS
jgi:predicted PurR-regulated permease PerM